MALNNWKEYTVVVFSPTSYSAQAAFADLIIVFLFLNHFQTHCPVYCSLFSYQLPLMPPLLSNSHLLLYLHDMSDFLPKYLLSPSFLTIHVDTVAQELTIEYFPSFVYCLMFFLTFYFITEQCKCIVKKHTKSLHN